MLKRIIATALGLLLLSAASADAQYFGRNKVQYDRFQFTILETPHFDVYYYPQERQAAEVAAQMAERWYARLSVTLDHTFSTRQPIILYASHSHFAQTSILPGDVPEGVGGFTDHLAGRVVLPFAAGLGETDHVLGHEIVHAFQRDILRHEGSSLSLLPLWFSEGMAEYLSVGDLDVNTRMWIRDAERSHHVPTLAQLSDPKYFPYRYGQALWAYLAGRFGEGVVVKALHARSVTKPIARLEEATGRREDELNAGWREFAADVAGDATRDAFATPLHRLIGGRPDDGQLNLGPALSPDGRFLVFLSERDRHAVDVYLADAKSGAILRKLLSTATDPHFDALQFIESAGAWDARSRSFVLATVRDGRPVLTIFDMPSGRVRRRIPVPDVDQIFSPAWSPTGGRLAFSGMKGGVTDIYAINLADGRVRALTHDLYSDLQPAWSPDGTEIAFTTDRFSSSVESLTFGRYELGMIAWPTGDVSRIGGTMTGKNIDPQWCPDASCVYFVSDETGVSNLYRMDVPSQEITQMTELPIGVSGVTALSPAISVGEAGTRVAMSVYGQGGYQIRALDVPLTALNTVAPPAAPLPVRPEQGSDGRQAQAAAANRFVPSFNTKPYAPSLSLFSLGQPYLSAGGGAFGSFVRAGMSVSVGDLFGEQELDSAIQVGKRASDFALETSYVNRRSRWNWGISGSQIPWLTGTGMGLHDSSTSSGEHVIVRDALLEQQEHRQVTGLLMYPFSRARRVEFSAGLDAVAFSRQVTSTAYSAETLRLIDETTTTVPSQRPATSFVGGAALVHDNAVFGIASPVFGERYRIGLTGSVGDLTLATASGDYRRYFEATENVTLAFHAQEVARVGRAVIDPRVLPLVWTAREIVRGFDDDQVVERASQVSMANAEVRTPLGALLRRPGSGLPIEVFAYSDWARFAAPASPTLPSAVEQLWSAGIGARLNVAGFIFEFNGAHPVDMPGGWRLAVNFRPGF